MDWQDLVFQSTPPVKAATNLYGIWLFMLGISIHAAREGGDSAVHRDAERADRFQSTPPVKAATYTPSLKTEPTIYFNPRRP